MLNLTISTGDSRKSVDWKAVDIEWGELVDRLSSPIRTRETADQYTQLPNDKKADLKDVGGFVGGRIEGGQRKASSVQERSLLTLDADFAEADFWRRYEQTCEYEAVMYSTHSHRPDHCRFRLVIPLSHPVGPVEYEAIARMVAREVGIDLFDDTTYEPNRLMYWPSCPSDGEYVFRHQEGILLDPDDVLDQYNDWRDEREWPVSSRVNARVRSKIDKQGDPTEKPGLIGAFCRTYDVCQAIDKFLPDVYRKESEGRYTFLGGSTYGGMKTFDGDRFVYSWHSTDPLHGRLLNSFDLVRLHLYRALDDGTDETTTSVTELPSYHEMLNLCTLDAAVIEDYKAHMTE